MALRKLNMAPNQDGYAVAGNSSPISAKLMGGASRFRKDYLNATVTVDVAWTCDEAEFLYLKTFYRVQNDGVDPFLMDLLIDSPVLQEYQCRIVPGTFRLASVVGASYLIKAQLEAVQGANDPQFDDGLVTTFESFGIEGSAAYTDLEYLVNTVLPDNLK